MNIKHNEPLSNHNTFYIGGPARYFMEVFSLNELMTALNFAKTKTLPVFILSGGSNILVSDRGFNGLVIKLGILGREIVLENSEEVILKVGSGEIWDSVVAFAVSANLYGIENLSHIPGRMGGVPVQNVGAYGQEAKDVIVSVDAFDSHTGKLVTLNHSQLKFGYRSSIFNTEAKGRYIILYTRLKLKKHGEVNLQYKDLAAKFPLNSTPSLSEVRQAIIEIRNQKFPIPSAPEFGNSGSWFKNPVLEDWEFVQLLEKFEQGFSADLQARLRAFVKTPGEPIKIPAAFLIEAVNLKNFSIGGAKINPKQPLVILNYTGKATAQEVLAVACEVVARIYVQFNIRLIIEPELVGFEDREIKPLTPWFT